MDELFEGMIPELKELVEWADKMDHFYPLTMLVDTDQYSAAHEEGDEYCAFLIRVLNELQGVIKVLFNKFIDEQVEVIKSTQVSVKRCGVLPYFVKFPMYMDHMEGQRAGKESRKALNSVIDTAYHKIVMSLFSWLDGLGDKELEKFRFIAKLENYHHFSAEISRRKVPCMETYQKTAFDLYIENQKQYAQYLINRQFKVLLAYFKEMDDLLQTLPSDDIQFQSSHSKQALRKLTDKFGASALEKGLTKAIKNIYKNLSVEEDLAPDVWAELQRIFAEQYAHYESLVAKCYKSKSLPVSSAELQNIFNTVAEKYEKIKKKKM